jgi:hypothetical protein
MTRLTIVDVDTIKAKGAKLRRTSKPLKAPLKARKGDQSVYLSGTELEDLRRRRRSQEELPREDDDLEGYDDPGMPGWMLSAEYL